MKNASTEAALTALLAAVHRKLGMFRSGKPVSWNDNYSTGGEFVTIGFVADYERGAAQESFVFRITDGAAKLAGYHVNSNALILN